MARLLFLITGLMLFILTFKSDLYWMPVLACVQLIVLLAVIFESYGIYIVAIATYLLLHKRVADYDAEHKAKEQNETGD